MSAFIAISEIIFLSSCYGQNHDDYDDKENKENIENFKHYIQHSPLFGPKTMIIQDGTVTNCQVEPDERVNKKSRYSLPNQTPGYIRRTWDLSTSIKKDIVKRQKLVFLSNTTDDLEDYDYISSLTQEHETSTDVAKNELIEQSVVRYDRFKEKNKKRRFTEIQDSIGQVDDLSEINDWLKKGKNAWKNREISHQYEQAVLDLLGVTNNNSYQSYIEATYDILTRGTFKKVTTRPDGISFNAIIEHKHKGGKKKSLLIYDSLQFKAQREMCKDVTFFPESVHSTNPPKHIIVLTGLFKDKAFWPKPTLHLATKSELLYIDFQNQIEDSLPPLFKWNQITNEWQEIPIQDVTIMIGKPTLWSDK